MAAVSPSPNHLEHRSQVAGKLVVVAGFLGKLRGDDADQDGAFLGVACRQRRHLEVDPRLLAQFGQDGPLILFEFFGELERLGEGVLHAHHQQDLVRLQLGLERLDFLFFGALVFEELVGRGEDRVSRNGEELFGVVLRLELSDAGRRSREFSSTVAGRPHRRG